MAAPEREVYSLVGDGSYLMMAQEIVTAVSEDIKLIIVIVQNHGFSSIGSLSESLGSQRFGTWYRYRNADTGLLDGDKLPDRPRRQRREPGRRRHPGEDDRRVPRRARRRPAPRPAPPRSTSRPTRWPRCRRRRAGGTCRSPRSAQLDSTQQARKTYEAHKAEQRPFLDPRSRGEPIMSAPTDLSRLTLGTAPTPGGCGSRRTRTRWAGSSTSTRWRRPVTCGPSSGRRASCRRTRAAARRARPARPEGVRRHGVRRPAPGQGGAGQGDRGVRPGGAAARARSARSTWSTSPSSTPTCTPARPPRPPTWTRSSGRTWSRAPTSWAGCCSRSTASSWCSTRTSTPTSTPRSGSSSSSGHRPAVRQPVPGHRAHRLLRRRQRADRRAAPRADHLRAPQAGRPGGPRTGARGEAAAVRGRQAGRHGRAAVRRARRCRRCWTRWPSSTATCSA